jgi:KaiC/GvpD/RAD55 family RecA-like ATPase
LIERKIIAAAAKSRSAYETILASMEPADLGPIYLPIWGAVADYYALDPKAANADTVLVTDKVAATGAGTKRQNALKALCEEVFSEDVSPANIAEYIRDRALDSAAMRFAQAAAGRKGHGELEGLARAYVDLLDKPESVDEGDEALTFSQALRKRVDVKNRLRVTPACLNERLGGGLFPGNTLWIFGRPNRGKTALAITLACGFARRGLRGLWLTNEDPALSVMVRCASNLTGLTEAEIAADPDTAEKLAIEKGITRITFQDIAPGTAPEIEAAVKRVKPEFIVVDQVRNLSMRGTDGNANRIDAAAQFVRQMAKKYQLVAIGMAQADAASAHKLVLDMEDFDSSKTGMPGAADVIVGVSGNEDMENAGQRMLSVSKNKVSNVHGHWSVNFNPFLSRYSAIK